MQFNASVSATTDYLGSQMMLNRLRLK